MSNARNNLLYKLAAGFLAFLLLWAIHLPFVQTGLSAKAAETSKTVSVTIRQVLTSGKDPVEAHTYALVPKEGSPMPEGTDALLVDLKGLQRKDVSLTFTTPGNYEYKVGRVATKSPVTFTKSQEIYEFGFMVRRGDDGTLTVTPYTCINDELKLLENGVSCEYGIAGIPETTTTTTTVRNRVSYPTNTRVTTKVTPKKGAKVNTGDPAQTVLWVTLGTLSGLGLLLIFFLRRRDREDEE